MGGGGGRGKCPTPCKKGRRIVRKKAMSGEYVQAKCPDTPETYGMKNETRRATRR